jgi:hypothetical protein
LPAPYRENCKNRVNQHDEPNATILPRFATRLRGDIMRTRPTAPAIGQAQTNETGRLATANHDALARPATAMEKRFQVEKHNEYLEKPAAGDLDTQQKKLLPNYLEEFDRKQRAWHNLQVLLVG